MFYKGRKYSGVVFCIDEFVEVLELFFLEVKVRCSKIYGKLVFVWDDFNVVKLEEKFG